MFTFAGFTGDNSQESEQADLIHWQAGIRPCCVQTVTGTALLSGHPSHQHHVTPLVLALLQPAHPPYTQRHIYIYTAKAHTLHTRSNIGHLKCTEWLTGLSQYLIIL